MSKCFESWPFKKKNKNPHPKMYLLILERKGGWGGERERERKKEKHGSVPAVCAQLGIVPNWGSSPQPRCGP